MPPENLDAFSDVNRHGPGEFRKLRGLEIIQEDKNSDDPGTDQNDQIAVKTEQDRFKGHESQESKEDKKIY